MTIKAHAFEGKVKSNWRDHNLSFFVSMACLIDNAGKARGSILETAGTTATHSFDGHMEKGTLQSADQFVLVEIVPETYLKLCLDVLARYPDKQQRPRVVFGEACAVTMSMFKSGDPVGMCNLDLCNVAGDSSWWANTGPILLDMVRRGIEDLGGFALILNQTLDMPKENPALRSERIREQTRLLCQWFQPWEVTPIRLLGAGPTKRSKVVEDSSYRGQLGAYEIYRGETRKFRMATIRLCFTRKGVVIDQEPVQ